MEFHAVICCGKGVNLTPFSKVRESGITKALLPIANKPTIEYVLEWCDRAPFRAVTVVTDSDSHSDISQVIESYKTKRPSQAKLSALNVISFDGESTGEIFDEFLYKVEKSTDFILLPCDFITDLPPQVLIEEYRNRSDDDIAMSVHYLNKFESIDKNNLTHYYTVYSDDEHLLDIYSKDSVELSKILELRAQMVWRYPNTNVSTKLLDSFIYFFSPKALEILRKEGSDFKGKSITKIIRDLARRSWKHSEQRGTISFFVLPSQCNFIRSDNIPAYLESNRYMMKLQAQKSQQPAAVQTKEKGAATIGADSLVGETTVLGERTSVKKTVVGNGCSIGKRCRLTGCVLLDGITLEDDVVLENCIIGQNAVVHNKARLTNCNVEGGSVVNKGAQIKGETLMNLVLEGQDDELSSSEGESEDYESYEDDFEDDFEDDGLFER